MKTLMKTQMRAFRRLERTHWAADTVTVPIPTPGPGQYLLKVEEAACCGSDLHALNNAPGTEAFPSVVTFGHELSAKVEGGGEGTTLKRGTPVTMIAIQGCTQCPFCRGGLMQLCQKRRVQGLMIDGGMAEYVVVDKQFVKPVPESLSVTARALIEPTTIGYRCVKHLGDLKGKRIVLPGAGIIGLLSALIARKAGADVTMTGIPKDEHTRLAKAASLGFKTIVTGSGRTSMVEQFRALNGGKQADILLDASGAPEAVVEGWSDGPNSVVRPGGEIMLVAIYERPLSELFLTSLVRWERRLTTSYGSDPSEYDGAIALLEDGTIPVADLVTYYPLDQAMQAYKDAASSKVLKPVVQCAV